MQTASTIIEKRYAVVHVSRKSHWGQYMCCVFITILVNFPCVSLSYQGVDISVSLYPENSLYLLYGKPLELICVTENNFTASDLEFVHNGAVIDSEIVNTTTKRFYDKSPSKGVLSLYCRNKVTNKTCITKVLIDSPPSNITDFGCVSKNIDSIKCSWTRIKSLAITNYTLEFLINYLISVPCIAKRDGEKMYCIWDTKTSPRYRQHEQVFVFNLRTCNYFGCLAQTFTIDHYSIVKPDPPENIQVLSNEPHSVQLSWNIPNNMVDFLDSSIMHRVEYTITKSDNITHFRSVNASNINSKTKKKMYTFTLENLPYAYKSYEVRICIKPENANDLYWSDFSYVSFTTASEQPQRPPDTIVGAFDQSIYNDKRIIYVYWRQLEEYEEAGPNFTYKIVVKQGFQYTQTLFLDKSKSLSYVILNGVSLEGIDVSIWSTNDVGSSNSSSYLYIPPKPLADNLTIHSFTILAFENGTYKLSWIGGNNIDNYTLFWCKQDITKICVDRLNFTVVESEKNTYVIDLPNDDRYQFAISANSGTQTTGMIWNSCLIHEETLSMFEFPLKIYHSLPGTSFVKISWTMPCSPQDSIITGYTIKYCPLNIKSNICDTTIENETMYYIDDPQQMEINITNLIPDTTYQFKLELNTTFGMKPVENAYTVVTTMDDTPTNPKNVRLSNISYDSFVVSWDPPRYKTIGKYIILDRGQEIRVDIISDSDKNVGRRAVNVTGLKPFTMYSISVKACGIRSCSKPKISDLIFVRTRIAPPSAE